MAQVVNKRKLTAGDLHAIGQLLVEALGGEITSETRQSILELDDSREIPPPYGGLSNTPRDMGWITKPSPMTCRSNCA
ncbi:MAG TPA: hypothetical protein VK897_16690 [Anaerolineales bacterium]|nr:hypothetical protein [Anaerolineales bacterium]